MTDYTPARYAQIALTETDRIVHAKQLAPRVKKDPYRAEAYATAQKKGFSRTADAAVNLNFALGDLASGQSTAVTFYFGVTDDLPATLAAIKGEAA